LLAVGCAATFLRLSQLNGRLAQDLTYDDVGYANDAFDRLALLARHGLIKFINDFVQHPPHSPYSTILAFCGFLVGGVNDLAMYAANSLMLVVVAIFVTHETRQCSQPTFLICICAILFSPLAFVLMENSRPDIFLGFAMT